MGLTFYAFTTKTDFTGMGPYLFVAFFALMLLGFACALMNIPQMQLLYSGLGACPFSMFIVFDTQLMLGEFKGHKQQFEIDEYVFAALTIYLDILNPFLDLLQLLGDR